MDDLRGLRPLALAGAAALAAVFGLAWRAAEEHRGLDLADLRSVAIIAIALLVVAALLDRRSRGAG